MAGVVAPCDTEQNFSESKISNWGWSPHDTDHSLGSCKARANVFDTWIQASQSPGFQEEVESTPKLFVSKITFGLAQPRLFPQGRLY